MNDKLDRFKLGLAKMDRIGKNHNTTKTIIHIYIITIGLIVIITNIGQNSLEKEIIKEWETLVSS